MMERRKVEKGIKRAGWMDEARTDKKKEENEGRKRFTLLYIQ